MRAAIYSLFTFAMAALVTAADKTLYLNPPDDVLKSYSPTSPVASTKPIVGRMTNAKRLSMKLPPLKPKALQRGTRAATARRSGTSMLPPIPYKGNILVKNKDDGSTFGYITPTFNGFGEYGIVQPDQGGSLEVTFNASPDDSSPDELDFLAVDGPSASYPYFGATTGFASTSSDLGPGSYNYAYVTGTTQTQPGSPPVDGDNNSFRATTGIPETAESAIWKYNPLTQEITAQWINTDGSRPATPLLYANDFNQAFIMTGDVAVLQSAFGVPYPPITFTCVPPQTTTPMRE